MKSQVQVINGAIKNQEVKIQTLLSEIQTLVDKNEAVLAQIDKLKKRLTDSTRS